MAQAATGGKLLAAIDGSGASSAVARWAVAEARTRGIALTVVYAWHDPLIVLNVPGTLPVIEDEIAADGQDMLTRVMAPLTHDGDPSVDFQVLKGPAHHVIIKLAADPTVALVTVGRRRGHPLAAALWPVGRLVLHHCPKPLVVVPSWPDNEDPARASRIVVGVDGSPGAESALRWAIAEAGVRDGCLEVVTAWERPHRVLSTSLSTGELTDQELHTASDETLRTSLEHTDLSGVSVKQTVAHGEPADVLMEIARSGDLLVVGSTGSSTARVLGSVAHTCATHCTIPVAVVPPSGGATNTTL
jgi:nucleotide-binding universal stress UspA family protein